MVKSLANDLVFMSAYLLFYRKRQNVLTQGNIFLSKFLSFRQRKDELEQRMSALQESRRELMVQLESLMKLLKVRCVTAFNVGSISTLSKVIYTIPETENLVLTPFICHLHQDSILLCFTSKPTLLIGNEPMTIRLFKA